MVFILWVFIHCTYSLSYFTYKFRVEYSEFTSEFYQWIIFYIHLLQGMRIPSYDNQLLNLAEDLGRRLLPAFDTPTGIASDFLFF